MKAYWLSAVEFVLAFKFVDISLFLKYFNNLLF